MLTYNHFDQFEILGVIRIMLGPKVDLTISNTAIFLVLTYGILRMSFKSTIEKDQKLIPTIWASFIELVYMNVYNIIKDNISKEGYKYYTLIFTLFTLISLSNVIGVLPYTFAPTAHIIITFSLSLSIFLGCTIIALGNFKSNFFAMFTPAGSPMVLAPFLVIIEFISYIARAISLGVRLAANITAGHLLFSIISTFAWNMIISGTILTIIAIVPILILVAITVLELAVALIQAYVFTLLTTIYLNDSINLH